MKTKKLAEKHPRIEVGDLLMTCNRYGIKRRGQAHFITKHVGEIMVKNPLPLSSVLERIAEIQAAKEDSDMKTHQ